MPAHRYAGTATGISIHSIYPLHLKHVDPVTILSIVNISDSLQSQVLGDSMFHHQTQEDGQCMYPARCMTALQLITDRYFKRHLISDDKNKWIQIFPVVPTT